MTTISLSGLDMPWLKRDRSPVKKKYRHRPNRRSDLPAPMISTDECEVKSQVDGKVYTSKSKLRQSYRDGGYVEVGNEDITKHVKKPKKDKKAMRDSIGKAFNRVGLPTT